MFERVHFVRIRASLPRGPGTTVPRRVLALNSTLMSAIGIESP
jgi:hypothetical protein